MTEHTPGPWIEEMGLIHDTNGYCTNDTGPLAVVRDPAIHGHTFGGSQHPMSIHTTEEMAQANAHLIAAAPKLLTALQRCLESQESNGYIGCKTEDEARAVVAEATGQPYTRQFTDD